MYNVLCISIPTYILKTKKENFMKNSKKILLFAVIVTLFTLLFALGASAEDVATSGSCGTNATWSFDSATGTLTISGSGATTNYTADNRPPYYAYASTTKKIVVEEGITALGNRAFQNFTAATEISLPMVLRQSVSTRSRVSLLLPNSPFPTP